MTDYLSEAMAIREELSFIRREIHKKPEVGMELPFTTAFVVEQLRKHGIEAKTPIECGVSALIEGGKPGRTLLIRADMDALPIQEDSGENFSSEFEGKMHGCGHDMHTAILLGVAILLNKHKNELSGQVKLMWQPGEEIFEGAKAMMKAGILENPKPDAAFDLHVDASTNVGNLFYSKGPFTTSADNYLIRIAGRGSHGSSPQSSIDPLNVAIQIYNAISAMRMREIAASEYLAMSICSIASGSSYNIIPDSVELRGTMRTYNPQLRDYVVKRIEEIAKQEAAIFGAKVTFEIVQSAPTIINNEEMADKVAIYLEDFGMEFETDPNVRISASDDFGYIAREIPSLMFFLGCKPEGAGNNLLHNPKVVFDEEALPIGSALLSHVASKWLEEHS